MFFFWIASVVVAFGLGLHYGPKFKEWIDEVM